MNLFKVGMTTVAAALRCSMTAGLILVVGPALACKGPNVKFMDDFRQIDDSWDVDRDTDAVTVEDGKARIKAGASEGFTVLYGGFIFDDADFCVTVQVPWLRDNVHQPAAGLVFWGEDYGNYYTFAITPGGEAAIVRRVKGTWFYVIDYRKVDSIKTGPGDKNVLRVTTRGDSITTYVNDTKFASVRAQVPKNGGQIGLHAESEMTHRNTWDFTDLKVTDLPLSVGENRSPAIKAFADSSGAAGADRYSVGDPSKVAMKVQY
jgi:hypothetical protein